MFRVIPVRMSMWRAGWVMLTLSVIASYVGASTHRLTAPGIELAPPSNGRSWVAFAVEYLMILVCGWLSASELWPKWRQRELTQSVAVAQPPSMRVRWTWTMKQVLAGGLFLVVGIGQASVVADTVDAEVRLIIGVAVVLGTFGVTYLMLAWRVGKLEQGCGVVYFWQRQPGFANFLDVCVDAVPVYAVLY